MSRKIDGITVSILLLVLSDVTSQSQYGLLLTDKWNAVLTEVTVTFYRRLTASRWHFGNDD